jgi:hypothetical protein
MKKEIMEKVFFIKNNKKESHIVFFGKQYYDESMSHLLSPPLGEGGYRLEYLNELADKIVHEVSSSSFISTSKVVIWCSYLDERTLNRLKATYRNMFRVEINVELKNLDENPDELNLVWNIAEAESLLEERRYADYLAFCQIKNLQLK